MSKKRTKGYWLKRRENFSDATTAKNRAGSLRMHEHTSHVQVQPTQEGFEVTYSVAKWYLEELKKAGCKL